VTLKRHIICYEKHFVWLLDSDLSGMGDPTSRYATASLSLILFVTHSPLHHDKMMSHRDSTVTCDHYRTIFLPENNGRFTYSLLTWSQYLYISNTRQTGW